MARPAASGEILCVQVPPNARSEFTVRIVGSAGADRATTSMVTSPSVVSYSQGTSPSTASSFWTRRAPGVQGGRAGASEPVFQTTCALLRSSASRVVRRSAGVLQPMAVTATSTATMSAASIKFHGKGLKYALFGKVLDLQGAAPIN